ncbi:NINE protein [Candidatus Cyanaurora vandensis]|uniref:NINE protein n=1 Tax=Candidatus Cyanaurora vandensis TaxID=2714958 RepID=UPI00258035E2|nr:NINE protein [Candidatus Cyanaurora vandensis]
MRNKVVAALLAFFLGGFGLHKFYLGQTGWGVLYLVFCWTLVPGLAGFVESILLLLASDQDFDHRFNPNILPFYSGNPVEQALGLERLAELHAKGLVTDEEFEAKRRQLLERM